MNVWPTELKIVGESRLRIEWSDGRAREYAFKELRDRCPCATCREKRGQIDGANTGPARPAALLPVLSPQEAQPLKILGMKPVGNYAYAINFSDGHDTGIFTFELLRELGSQAA